MSKNNMAVKVAVSLMGAVSIGIGAETEIYLREEAPA